MCGKGRRGPQGPCGGGEERGVGEREGRDAALIGSTVGGMALDHIYSGKVRDIYDAGEGRLLMVTSDRISAFDVVMNEPVPSKGRVLTAMTAFWLDHLSDVAGSHLISTSLDDVPPEARRDDWAGRVML